MSGPVGVGAERSEMKDSERCSGNMVYDTTAENCHGGSGYWGMTLRPLGCVPAVPTRPVTGKPAIVWTGLFETQPAVPARPQVLVRYVRIPRRVRTPCIHSAPTRLTGPVLYKHRVQYKRRLSAGLRLSRTAISLSVRNRRLDSKELCQFRRLRRWRGDPLRSVYARKPAWFRAATPRLEAASAGFECCDLSSFGAPFLCTPTAPAQAW